MKIKIIGIKMLAQCPICMAIKMNTGDKNARFIGGTALLSLNIYQKRSVVGVKSNLQVAIEPIIPMV
jgi:hypothetical protein